MIRETSEIASAFPTVKITVPMIEGDLSLALRMTVGGIVVMLRDAKHHVRAGVSVSRSDSGASAPYITRNDNLLDKMY
jgi:hypothetical protein